MEGEQPIEVYIESLDEPKAWWCTRYGIDMAECEHRKDSRRLLWAYGRALTQALDDPAVLTLIELHPVYQIEVVHKHGGPSWIMQVKRD